MIGILAILAVFVGLQVALGVWIIRPIVADMTDDQFAEYLAQCQYYAMTNPYGMTL